MYYEEAVPKETEIPLEHEIVRLPPIGFHMYESGGYSQGEDDLLRSEDFLVKASVVPPARRQIYHRPVFEASPMDPPTTDVSP